MRLIKDLSDVVVYDADGYPLLACQVRNIPGLDAGQAQELRDSILPHIEGRRTPFWLMISQEKAFLWREEQGEGTPPALEFEFAPMRQRFAAPEFREGQLSEGVLEAIVWSWLLQLTTGHIQLPSPLIPGGLEDLWHRMRGGDVVTPRDA